MASGKTQKKSFSALLGIEEREKSGVALLFIHHFFQGLGIAFFFTASVTLFLYKFHGLELASSFVYGGIGMLIASRVYAHFEHQFRLEKFLPFVVLFLSLSSMGIWIGFHFTHNAWFIFLIFSLYRILYLLSNLEFWGLTSLLFNVRQGKRLFGIIGSGDIPAKVLGYISVYLLVPLVGVEALFLLSSLFFLCSFSVLLVLFRKLRHEHHFHASHGHEAVHANPEKFIARLFGNRFIVLLSLFSFLVGIAMVLIDFGFYGEVKLKFKKSDDLTVFLSLFLAGVMSLTFLLKLFLSGKILQKTGVKNSLLIFLVCLLIPALVLAMMPASSLGLKMILFFFAGIYALRDTLKFTLFDPALLSMFQPLSQKLRLKGHTVIKGMVDGFSVLCGGLLLWLLAEFPAEDVLKMLALGIGIFVLISVPALLAANREWVATLKSAVRKRFLDGTSLPMADPNMLGIIHKSLGSTSPGEVVYALKLIEQYQPDSVDAELLKTLEMQEEEVVVYSLERLLARQKKIPKALLMKLVQSPKEKVREKAIAILAADVDGWTVFREWEDLPGRMERMAALRGMLENESREAVEFARQKIRSMMDSGEKIQMQDSLWLIGEFVIHGFESDHLRLMEHPDRVLRSSALESGLKSGMKEPSEELFRRAVHGPGKIEARNSLARAGERMIGMIPLHEPEIICAACRALGKTNGSASENFLLEMVSREDQSVRTSAISALVERRYFAGSDQVDLFKKQFEHSNQRLIKILGWLHSIKRNPALIKLEEALYIELAEEVAEGLNLLSCFAPPFEIQRARQGLHSASHELRADAVEILEHLLPKQNRKLFLGVLENIYLQHSMPDPEAGKRVDPVKVIHEIISGWDGNLNSWTLSAAFHNVFENFDQTQFTDQDLSPNPIPAVTLQTICDLKKSDPERFARVFPSSKLQHQLDHFMNTQIVNDDSLTLLEKVIFLKRVNMFSGTPDNILAEVAAICNEEKAEADVFLLRKGDPGNCMFIIVDGEVAIQQDGQVLAVFSKGDFFGELSLIETEMRSADAVTTRESFLLRIDQDDFYELVEDRVEVMRSILVTLAGRIRSQNELINKLRKA